MRPPDLPGGNTFRYQKTERTRNASMRPPDLPGGNVTYRVTDGAGTTALQ